MFARLFGPDDDQLLLLLDTNEKGKPQLTVHFQPRNLGVCCFKISWSDNPKGWAAAENALATMTEAQARHAIASVRAELEGR